MDKAISAPASLTVRR
uniref:Uncharacterized protein n=1 Tax=Arundo donax TaxID=35708 RepID=A0A0A8YHF1_ARUDO